MGQSKPHTAFEQALKALGSFVLKASDSDSRCFECVSGFDSSFFWGKRALKAPPPKTGRQQLTLLGGAFSKEALIKTSTERNINNSVSLYPLTALALAACGGGGGGGGGGSPTPGTDPNPNPNPGTDPNPNPGTDPAPTEPLSGRVYDGPVVGAQIYFDVNENGVQDDADVQVATTDALGSYTISAEDVATYGADTPVLAVLDGAIDIGDVDDPSDDITLTSGTWQTPAGSSVISPLTDFLVKADIDNARVVELLGLPEGVDVTEYDPYESGVDDATASAVIEAGQEVAQVLEVLEATDTEVTVDTVVTTVERVLANPPTNFTLTSVVAELPEDADTGTRTKVADLDVTDADTANAEQGYILSGDDEDLFEVEGAELYLKAGVELDFERALADGGPTLDVTVTVAGTRPPLRETHTITITNVDDNAPTDILFTIPDTLTRPDGTIATVELPENSAAQKLADITFEDVDGGNNAVTVDDDTIFEIRTADTTPASTTGGLELWLKAGAALDYETASEHSVTLQATTDGTDVTINGVDLTREFTLAVTDVDDAPTAFELTPVVSSLAEDADTTRPIKVADLDVTDVDTASGDQRFTRSGSGGDATRFEVIGAELFLRAGVRLDHETKSNLRVTVRVLGTDLTATHNIRIRDVDEPPTAFRLVDPNDNNIEKASVTLAENSAAQKLADITFTDDALGTNAVTIVTGTNPSDIFELRNSDTELWLKAGAVLDYETTPNSYTVRLQATTNTALTQDFTLTVTNVDEPPTGIEFAIPSEITKVDATTVSLAEDVDIPPDPTTGGIKLADITILDDALGSNAVTVPVNAIFEIRTSSDGDNQLWLKASAMLDYETPPNSYTITLTATTNSALTQTFTLEVTDVDEAPTAFVLTNVVNRLAEDAAAQKLADITLTDEDGGNNGVTIPDNAVFEIRTPTTTPASGGGIELWLKADALDYETPPNIHGITLQATTDGADVTINGVDLTELFTLTVTNVPSAPTISVSGSQMLTLNEGTTAYSAADNSDRQTGYSFTAADIEDGDTVTLSVNDNRFEIVDGALLVKTDKVFDYEATALDESGDPTGEITLTITATDNSPEMLTATQDVTITVMNVDSDPTIMVVTNTQTLTLNEGTTAATLSDTEAATGYTFTATAEDGSATTLSVEDDRFEIVSGALRIRTEQVFDYEATTPDIDGNPSGIVTVVVTATDANGRVASTSVTITITDVDEPPTAFRLVDPNDNSIEKASATLAENVIIPPDPINPSDPPGGIKLADITFTDDALGTNAVTIVPSTDPVNNPSNIFELRNSNTELWLRHDAVLDYETTPNSYTVTLQATTNTALTQTFMLTVTDVDEPPTAFRLVDPNDNNLEKTSATLAEDVVIPPAAPFNPTSGGIKLADIIFMDDALGTNAVTIVPSTDPVSNPSDIFEIRTSSDGDNQLWLRHDAVLDYETTPNSYTVTLQATTNTALRQTFTLEVTDVDEAPTAFVLTNVVNRLAEDAAAQKLADITLTDEDGGNNGVTIPDNAVFEIRTPTTTPASGGGIELWLKADALDYETPPNIHGITLQATTDGADVTINGVDLTKLFTLTVTNVDEAPTKISFRNAVDSLAENSAPQKLADIIFTDVDGGNNAVTVPDNDIFEIRTSTDGDTELWLKAGAVLDYETATAHTVTLQATTDGTDVTSVIQNFTLTVANVAEAPTLFTLANVVNTLARGVRTAERIKIADLVVVDDDTASADQTYTVTSTNSDNDAALFEVDGAELFLIMGASLDARRNPSLDVTVTVDGTNPSLTQTHSVTVDASNRAPTAFALRNVAVNTLAELVDGTTTTERIKIADLVVTDRDTDRADQTYFLSGDDAALFEVEGAELFLIASASLDFETNPSLDVTVTVAGTSLTRTHTITLTDVDDAPTAFALAIGVNRLAEGDATTERMKLADLVVTDVDTDSANQTYTLDGADKDLFEVIGAALYLQAGVSLDFERPLEMGGPSLEVTVTVDGTSLTQDFTLTVTNVASAPVLSMSGSQTLDLDEGTTAYSATDNNDRQTGYSFSATDEDGDGVTLRVNDDRFEIVSGALLVKTGQVFDYETTALNADGDPSGEITLTITATDDSREALTATQDVTITVLDVTSDPTITIETNTQTLTLSEGTTGPLLSDSERETGYTFTATAEDGSATTLSVEDDRFELVGGALRIKTGQVFNFETENPLTVFVVATDANGRATRESVTIEITNVAPVLQVGGEQTLTLNEGFIDEDIATGYTVSVPNENDGDVVFGVFNGLAIDNRFAVVNGELVVVAGAVFDYETQDTLNLTIAASDGVSSESIATQTVDIAVTDLVDFEYDGIAPGIGRAGAVARGVLNDDGATRTTAHIWLPMGETATYSVNDFTVYEQNDEGDYVVSTRFDITRESGVFVLTLLPNNPLPLPTPSSTPKPINVRVEASNAVAGDAVPTNFQVVTAEHTLWEYGLDRDTLTGTVMLPGVTSVEDIIATRGRASYDNALTAFGALGGLTLELVDATTGEFGWTYKLDHNGPGLNHQYGDDGLMSEIFALSGGGTTQYVAVNVQTLWNVYRLDVTDADKDKDNDYGEMENEMGDLPHVRGSLGNDILKGFGGNDDIFGFGGNDVLIGGAGIDRIYVSTQGFNTPGSSTVIHRFASEGRTARSIDDSSIIRNFELGIDRLMLIDTDEDTPITDVAGLINLAKGVDANTAALFVGLIPTTHGSDDTFSGIGFTFQQNAAEEGFKIGISAINQGRAITIYFEEPLTYDEARARFGADATTPEDTYIRTGQSGKLQPAAIDALGTFFGDSLLVVDTDVNLDIY